MGKQARDNTNENRGVLIGYVHGAQVSGDFATSMTHLLVHDSRHGGHVMRNGSVVNVKSGPMIHKARNEICRVFLDHPMKPAWLWMVDTDMVFEPNTLDRLLQAADPHERPIVGGLCFAGGMGGRVFPTLYRAIADDNGNPKGVEICFDYPADAVVKVDATGAASLLIHRNVIEHLGKRIEGPSPWFAWGEAFGLDVGEDVMFCLRARAAGYPVFVHTGVILGHMKTLPIDEVSYAEYREKKADSGDIGVRDDYLQRMRILPQNEVPLG